MSRQAEIRERLEKMDDREWKKRGLAVVCQMGTVAECPTPQKGGMFDCQGNATFIAAAPGDIRYLLDRLEKAEGLLARFTALWNPKNTESILQIIVQTAELSSDTESFLKESA